MKDRETERDPMPNRVVEDVRPGPGTPIHAITLPCGGRFDAVIYDLLDEPTDCIVNAANGGLSHGGGVAAAILESRQCCRRLASAVRVDIYDRIHRRRAPTRKTA